MTWPIVMVASREAAQAEFGFVPVGACWFAPLLLAHDDAGDLAPNYRRDWMGKRPPVFVKLPNGSDFNCDGPFWNKDGPYGAGWVVTGQAPTLTVSPSINIAGSYHGYIENGVVKNDVEGRVFPHARGFPHPPRFPMETNEQQTDEQQQAAFARSARIEALIADGKTQDEALAIVDQGAPDPAPAPIADIAPDPLEEPPRDDEELEPERVDSVTVKVRAIAPGYDGLRFREKGDVFPLTLVRGRTAPSWVELAEG